MDTYFKCPCGELMHEPEEKTNSTVTCSKCSRRLVVPRVPVAAQFGPVSGDEDIEEAKEVGDFIYPDPGAEACKPRTGINGLAVASLVLGLTSPFLGLLSIVAGALAVIFGGTAIKAISKNPGLTGKGMAVAGIILGSIGLLLGLLMIMAIRASAPQVNGSLNVMRLLYSAAENLI